jgi:hypothetical protein
MSWGKQCRRRFTVAETFSAIAAACGDQLRQFRMEDVAGLRDVIAIRTTDGHRIRSGPRIGGG